MGPYNSFCVLMGPLGALLVYMRLYVSLRVLRGPYATLSAFECPHWFFCVLMGPNKSSCVLMSAYGS